MELAFLIIGAISTLLGIMLFIMIGSIQEDIRDLADIFRSKYYEDEDDKF